MVKTMKVDHERMLMSFSEADQSDINNTDIKTSAENVAEDQLPARVANVSREEIRKYVQCKRVGNYLLGKTVGEGSFAKVKEALHIPTGEKVAIKIIDKNRARKDRYVSKNMRREARLLQMIRHPHIVQLLEVVETSQCYYLVFEFADGGDLMDYICKKRKLDEEEVKKFIRQIISAVEYLHRLGIIHRDLKVENLLLDANKNIKIIDFGLSNTIFSSDPKNENHCTTQCGSPAYAAPELLVRKDYGPQIDVWSIGVNMYAMLTGRLPYTCEPFNISTLYHKMLMKEMNSVPEYLTDGCKDFIHQLLNPNPVERVSLLQATRNTWLTNIQTEPILLITCPNYLREEDLDDRILDHVESRLKLNSDDVIRDVIQNRATKNSCVYYLLLRRLDRYRREYQDIMASMPRSPPPTTTRAPTTTTPESTSGPASPYEPTLKQDSRTTQPKTHIIENPFKTIKVALIRQKKASKNANKSTKSVKFSDKKLAAAQSDNTPPSQLCSVKKVALVKVAPAKRSFRGVLSSARNLTSSSSSPMTSRRKTHFDGLQQRRKSPKVRRRNPDNDDSRSSIGSNSQSSVVLSKTAREAVRRRSQVMSITEMTLHEGKVSDHSSPRNTASQFGDDKFDNDQPTQADPVENMDIYTSGQCIGGAESLVGSGAENIEENKRKIEECEESSVMGNNEPKEKLTNKNGDQEQRNTDDKTGNELPVDTTAPPKTVEPKTRANVDPKGSQANTRTPVGTMGSQRQLSRHKTAERTTVADRNATRRSSVNVGQARRTSVDSRGSISTKGSSGSSVDRRGGFKSGSRVSFTGSRLDLKSSGSVGINAAGAQDENGEVIKEIGRLVNARISSITSRMSGEKFKPINEVYDKSRPVTGGGLANLRSTTTGYSNRPNASRSSLARKDSLKQQPPNTRKTPTKTNPYSTARLSSAQVSAPTDRYVAKTRASPTKTKENAPKLSDKYTKCISGTVVNSSTNPSIKSIEKGGSKARLEDAKQDNPAQKSTTGNDNKNQEPAPGSKTDNQDKIWQKNNLKKGDENKNGLITSRNRILSDVENGVNDQIKKAIGITMDQKGKSGSRNETRNATNDYVSRTQYARNKFSGTKIDENVRTPRRERNTVKTTTGNGKSTNKEENEGRSVVEIKNETEKVNAEKESTTAKVDRNSPPGGNTKDNISKTLNEKASGKDELNTRRSQILSRKVELDKNTTATNTTENKAKHTSGTNMDKTNTSVEQGSEKELNARNQASIITEQKNKINSDSTRAMNEKSEGVFSTVKQGDKMQKLDVPTYSKEEQNNVKTTTAGKNETKKCGRTEPGSKAQAYLRKTQTKDDVTNPGIRAKNNTKPVYRLNKIPAAREVGKARAATTDNNRPLRRNSTKIEEEAKRNGPTGNKELVTGVHDKTDKPEVAANVSKTREQSGKDSRTEEREESERDENTTNSKQTSSPTGAMTDTKVGFRRNSTTTERNGPVTTKENPVERLRRNFAKAENETKATNKVGQQFRRNSTKTDNQRERNIPATTENTGNSTGQSNKLKSTTDKNKAAGVLRRNSTKTESGSDNPVFVTNNTKSMRGLRKTLTPTDSKARKPASTTKPLEQLRKTSTTPAPDKSLSVYGLRKSLTSSTKKEPDKSVKQSTDASETNKDEEAKSVPRTNNTKPVYGLRESSSSADKGSGKSASTTKAIEQSSNSLTTKECEDDKPAPQSGETKPVFGLRKSSTSTDREEERTTRNVHGLRKSLTATFGETVKSAANNNNKMAYGLRKTTTPTGSLARKYSAGQPPKHNDVLRKTSWTGGERRQISNYRASSSSFQASEDDEQELRSVGPIPTYRKTAYKSCS